MLLITNSFLSLRTLFQLILCCVASTTFLSCKQVAQELKPGHQRYRTLPEELKKGGIRRVQETNAYSYSKKEKLTNTWIAQPPAVRPKSFWRTPLTYGWEKIKEGYTILTKREGKIIKIAQTLLLGSLVWYSNSLLGSSFVKGVGLAETVDNSTLLSDLSYPLSPKGMNPLYYQVSHDLCEKIDNPYFQNYCTPSIKELIQVAAAMSRWPEQPELRYEYKMMQAKGLRRPEKRDSLRYKPGKRRRDRNKKYIEKIAQMIQKEEPAGESAGTHQRQLLGLIQAVYGRGGTTRSDWASKIVAIDSSRHYIAAGLENTNGESNEAFIALFDRDMFELARTKFGISSRRDYAEGLGCIIQTGSSTLWDCYVAGETRGIPPTNQYDVFIVRFQVDLGNLTSPFSRVSEIAMGGASNDQVKDVLPFRYSQATHNGTSYNKTILLALVFEPLTSSTNGTERIMALLPEDGYMVKNNIGFSGVTNKSYESIALEQTTEDVPPLIVFVGWIVNSNGDQATLKEFFWGHNFTFLDAKIFQNNQGDNNLAYAINTYRRDGAWVTVAAGSYEEEGYPYVRGEVCVGLPPLQPVAHCVTFMGDGSAGSEANDLYARGAVYIPDYDFIFIGMSSNRGFSCHRYCNLYVLCDYAFTNCTAVVKDEVNDDWINSLTNSITGRDGQDNSLGGRTIVGCGKTRVRASSGSRDDEAYFLWRLNHTLESLLGNCGRPVSLIYEFRNFSLAAGTIPQPLAPINTFPFPHTLKSSTDTGQYIICEMRLPSNNPSKTPSLLPTIGSSSPSATPSRLPTSNPTLMPTTGPTKLPSKIPSATPSRLPTSNPTLMPTTGPTKLPSKIPTATPSRLPTSNPTPIPTTGPTKLPSKIPSATPSRLPTSNPTPIPTTGPTKLPSKTPSATPSRLPTSNPTLIPTTGPTKLPSKIPSAAPSRLPTSNPTPIPTTGPTKLPSKIPSATPSQLPTSNPTLMPTENGTAPLIFNSTSFPTENREKRGENITEAPSQPTLNPGSEAGTKKTQSLSWEEKYFAFERDGKSSLTYGVIILTAILVGLVIFCYAKYYAYKKNQEIQRVRAEINSFEDSLEMLEF